MLGVTMAEADHHAAARKGAGLRGDGGVGLAFEGSALVSGWVHAAKYQIPPRL